MRAVTSRSLYLSSSQPAPRQAKLKKQSAVRPDSEPVEQTLEASFASLTKAEAPWYRVASRVKLYTLLFPAAVMCYATSGYDGSMMNSLQTVSYWEDYFGNPEGSQLGLMSAIMALGNICSTPLAPLAADTLGRRWGITIGSIIMAIGAIIQCESRNYAMFVASRFILGFGLTFCTTAAPTLVAELSHPKERPTITAICNTCWYLDLSQVLNTVGIKDKDTQSLNNKLINIWYWLIALSSANITDRVGRRPLFRISTIGMLVVFTAWTIASALFAQEGTNAAGIAVIALIFLYQACYCVAFFPLPVAYSVEILPYSIRAKGMAVYVFSTKAAIFVNQYVNPIGLSNIGWRFYIVYVVILVIESFIAYGWFVETKGRSLEEIKEIFDGEEESEGLGKGDVEAKEVVSHSENVSVTPRQG
ncbi:major facilitator superfamily domain-containing protein [Aspergillus cavernicola]|uniref:Major facilitator superfamily domain-containing protein n=1 Tax=Aspergillus cavernicola TaxID=176166 RepID=A0ABR4HS07_9EURO